MSALVATLLAAPACGGGEDGNAERYSGLIAASEFVVGPNRFPFGLVSRDGAFLEDAAVSVRFFSLSGTERELHAEERATWRTIQGTTPHVHPDGERFLMARPYGGSAGDAFVAELIVVQNFFEDLRRLVAN